VPATSLSFDAYAQLLYATVPSTATTITGNSVVSINPYTGAVGNPIAVGSQPSMLAETDDGKYLYVGLSGANSLAQLNLLTQSLTATIPLTYQSTTTPPRSLATMPGSDTTLAVGISTGWNNFGIFDVNGSAGTFRPNLSGIYAGTNPVFASPMLLYAYDSQTSGAEFYRYSIDANGLTLIDGTTLSGMGAFNGAILPASGLVYGNAGGIANPNTTPPSQVAQLPLFDFYNECAGCDFGAGSLPDVSLQKEFLMLENAAGTWAYGLARYDLTTYVPETFVTMPASASPVSSSWTMLRFGQDGLALLSSDTNSTPPTSVVMLLRGPFVAPQELTTTSAASLTSSSATTIAHGTANVLLTLTGSNFLPGMAVTWNGSYRTTTILDSSHVTIAIPASDLVTAGTATVVATNPGASDSNALQITIN